MRKDIHRIPINSILIPIESYQEVMISKEAKLCKEKCGINVEKFLDLLNGLNTLNDITLAMNLFYDKILECAELLMHGGLISEANENYIILLYYYRLLNDLSTSLVKLFGKINSRKFAQKASEKAI